MKSTVEVTSQRLSCTSVCVQTGIKARTWGRYQDLGRGFADALTLCILVGASDHNLQGQ
jgi:hypothetical protein